MKRLHLKQNVQSSPASKLEVMQPRSDCNAGAYLMQNVQSLHVEEHLFCQRFCLSQHTQRLQQHIKVNVKLCVDCIWFYAFEQSYMYIPVFLGSNIHNVCCTFLHLICPAEFSMSYMEKHFRNKIIMTVTISSHSSVYI